MQNNFNYPKRVATFRGILKSIAKYCPDEGTRTVAEKALAKDMKLRLEPLKGKTMKSHIVKLLEIKDAGLNYLVRSDDLRGHFVHLTDDRRLPPGSPTPGRSVWKKWGHNLPGLIDEMHTQAAEYLAEGDNIAPKRPGEEVKFGNSVFHMAEDGLHENGRKISVGIDKAAPDSEDESVACIMEQIDGVLKVLGFERLGEFKPAGPDGFMGAVRRTEGKEKEEAGLAAMAGMANAYNKKPLNIYGITDGPTPTSNAALQNKIDSILKRAVGDLGQRHVETLQQASRDIQREVLAHVNRKAA